MTANVALFSPLRSLAFGSISASYSTVGVPLEVPTRVIRILNNTDGAMLFSTDGVVDQLFLPAGTFVLYDIAGNSGPNSSFRLHTGIQFSVKYSTVPTIGAVYIEAILGV